MSGWAKHILAAEEAVCARIVKVAEDADAEALHKLAGALSGLKFGAQGGALDSRSRIVSSNTQKTDYTTRYEGAYTLHRHDHSYRDEPRGAGFGSQRSEE